MALRSKPQQQPATADERRINELIEKGGTVPADDGDKSKPMLVQLRLSRDLVQRIDRNRKKRTVPPRAIRGYWKPCSISSKPNGNVTYTLL